MKKFLAIFLLALTGCGDLNVPVDSKRLPDPPSQWFTTDGYAMWVVTFEGHRYLTRNSGGIIHLESCECKTKH